VPVALPSLLLDPPTAAKVAGLRHVSDDVPGITRVRRGKTFSYVGTDGKPVRDEATLRRIKALAVPPAWTKVWICPLENGHIQAVGRDARGRKQYRYHARWRSVRDETKYHRILSFARALPRLRAQVDRDLGLRGLPREKVLATVVRLLETTLIRVGNDEYARHNKSFGLTTLQDRHVKLKGPGLELSFRGKSGVRHAVTVEDRRVARIVKACRDLPGQELFQYLDEEGAQRTINSADVNEYLHAIAGEEFTAKDFRTWAGTVLAALALEEVEKVDKHAARKKNVVRAIERVAARLGNTPSVCRKCYVHPAIVDSYLDGSLRLTLRRRAERTLRESLHELGAEEGAVLAFLQRRLAAPPSLSSTLKRTLKKLRRAA
jgi:DNA topoisomerase I